MPAPLTLVQQARLVTLRYPNAKTSYRTLVGDQVLWIDMSLQVAPVFERYRVMIGYTIGLQPAVYVVSPEPVKEAHGVPTPHLNYDGTLCLYDPGKKQWADTDAIAHTTIPWTLRWLFHYENWLSSGVWLGDTTPLAAADDVPATVPVQENSA